MLKNKNINISMNKVINFLLKYQIACLIYVLLVNFRFALFIVAIIFTKQPLPFDLDFLREILMHFYFNKAIVTAALYSFIGILTFPSVIIYIVLIIACNIKKDKNIYIKKLSIMLLLAIINAGLIMQAIYQISNM